MENNPLPQNDLAIQFLNQWSPQGPWVLTAIGLDRKEITTETFFPNDEPSLKRWLEKYNGKRNLYFHVNSVIRSLKTKAEREDIKSVDWLHVDIDPRVGEDLEKERKRALLLLENPPTSVPPPTVIIFSGGGYQGFWKLRESIPINGSLENAEQAKRYNIQLEVLFRADNCHNIDRIMRLPGTINLPDAKKQRKGRVPTLATVVAWNVDAIYGIEEFTPAPEVQIKQSDSDGSLGFSGKKISISGNVKRFANVEEIDDAIRIDSKNPNNRLEDRVKVLIVQGGDPDNPTKFQSRSECLFHVCCELVRVGASDDTIYSIITDPDFLISSSILDKGSSAERYALRQIERSREQAIDPFLRELNEKHAVIANIGGKCRIVEEIYDKGLKRARLTRQSFDDFRNRYCHIKVKAGVDKDGNQKYAPLGAWWLSHPKRRQYRTIVFAPGIDTEEDYNLWKGFACDARPGDCSLYLEHIKENICNDNEEIYSYVIKWMARAVQKPASPGYTAIVLRGLKGTGKSSFVKHFGSLWGKHFLQVSDPKHLVGSFNAHLRDCIILFGDEAFYAGDAKHESILKTLISEETFQIEGKGVDAEVAPNFTHLILASDGKWVVPAGAFERRYLVLDVGDKHLQDLQYFSKIDTQMNNGGREALLHHLMTLDISDFEFRKIPHTEALEDQKILSMRTDEEWWYNKLIHGHLTARHEDWDKPILKDRLHEDYIQYSKDIGLSRRSTATAIHNFLQKVCPKGWPKTPQKPVTLKDEKTGRLIQKRPYFYQFPSLEECRKTWDKLYGATTKWEKVDRVDKTPHAASSELDYDEVF